MQNSHNNQLSWIVMSVEVELVRVRSIWFHELNGYYTAASVFLCQHQDTEQIYKSAVSGGPYNACEHSNRRCIRSDAVLQVSYAQIAVAPIGRGNSNPREVQLVV